MTADTEQLVKQACGALQTAAAALKGPSRGQAAVPVAEQQPAQLKAVLAKAADRLKTEVSKCAVMAADVASDTAAIGGLLEGLQQQVISVCATCSALQAGGGPSLAVELHKLAEQIVSAATAFIEGAFLAQRSHDDVNRLAGMVFERCNAAKKAPLDNKRAIGRGLVKVASQVREVMREVSELRDELQASSAETAGPSGTAQSANRNGFSEVDESNAGVDFSTGDATPAEAVVVGNARDFLDRLLQFLKALLRVFTMLPSDLAGDVERWESILFHAKTLANPTNDLGAALYPTQDPEELRGTLDAAALGCEMIADELCSPNKSSAVQAEEEALQDATVRLRDAISALDRQQYVDAA